MSIAAALAQSWPSAMVAFAVTVVGTRRALDYLQRRQILDHPNERSSHSLPTPRGGGLAVTPAVLLGWLIAAGSSGWMYGLAGAAAVLFALSWWDDRHTLPAGPRFAVHGLAVAAGLALMPGDWLVFQGALPLAADRILSGLGWLWFLNLYNFMDGIDGITGVETASIGTGIALIAALGGAGALLTAPALALAAAGLGFLVWNWHPARIFLGDGGSIPLGYLLGGLLVVLAAHGHLAAALILPLYYLADATITITKRALRRERIWQAHRSHFYQRAVQGGHRHDQVVRLIAAANLLLVGAALVSLTQPWLALTAALAIVAALLAILSRWAAGGGA